MSNRRILWGWKEIARYLGLGVRTVQRHEVESMLPIRRPGEGDRSAVMAFSDEIDAWLRLARMRADSLSPQQVVASDTNQSRPVVVVEDRAEDVEFAKSCLSEAGFREVVVFDYPGPAIEYLQRSRDGEQPLPQGILVDLLLHQDNGFEVLRFCHSQPPLHGVPIVVWTQLLGVTEKEIAHWLGAKKFLTKGMTQQKMADKLRTLFSNSVSTEGTTPSMST